MISQAQAPPSAADARGELVERYLDDVLARWLELRSVPQSDYVPALADVRARLRALVFRWGSPELRPLLAPFVELAEWHEPRDVPVAVRALATVGVRNSALEGLHLDGYIDQADWRVLTMTAARFFAPLSRDSRRLSLQLDDDPFAGLEASFPCAYRAFELIAGLDRGKSMSWEMPTTTPREWPMADPTIQKSKAGEDVLDAMDERISADLSALMRRACSEDEVLFPPSFKHLSRNPRKLLRVVEVVLTNGGTIATQNVMLSPGRIARRAHLVDYNDRRPKLWWESRDDAKMGSRGARKKSGRRR